VLVCRRPFSLLDNAGGLEVPGSNPGPRLERPSVQGLSSIKGGAQQQLATQVATRRALPFPNRRKAAIGLQGRSSVGRAPGDITREAAGSRPVGSIPIPAGLGTAARPRSSSFEYFEPTLYSRILWSTLAGEEAMDEK
jgi:hypothetical protein